EAAVVFNQLRRIIGLQHRLSLRALQRGESVWFVPAVFEAENLGDELRIDQSAGTGLDGERILAFGRALLLDASAHVRDLLLPVSREGSDPRAFFEVGQPGGYGLKLRANLFITSNETRARQRLDFPKRGAVQVIV